MHGILLYRVIGVIRVIASNLGVVYGSDGTVDSQCNHVYGVLEKVSCSDGAGGGICAQQCVYAFGYVQIMLYDVGGCNINVIISPEEVD